MKTLFLTFGFFLSLALYADWDNEQKLTPSDGASYDHFAYLVSLDGDYAVIGAYWDDDNGYNSGSAYIFHKSGTIWTEQAKLTASDAAAEDYFGISVSISGDYAVIGAFCDDDNGSNSGSTYIFHRNGTTWTEQAKLSASDGSYEDLFGISVSISGDYALIGANRDDDNGNNSGSAYIFHRTGTTWTEQAKITASDGADQDLFGCPVSISGDYALIGSYRDDDNGYNSGSSYIFHRSGTAWAQQTKLTASDGSSEDWFGISISISEDYAIIGAYNDDDNGAESGSSYIFHRTGTTWTQQAKITASDGAAEDGFGRSVSINGNYALIGAYWDDDNGEHSGSAYLFHRSGTIWTEHSKITASDGAANDHFGISASIDGDYALIGAYYDNDNGTESGSAYIYHNDAVFIEEEQVNIPVNTILYVSYPNPFTTSTTVEYELKQPEKVTLTIYDYLGKQVEVIEANQSKGNQNIIWNAESLPDGIYYFRLQAGAQTANGKMLKLR